MAKTETCLHALATLNRGTRSYYDCPDCGAALSPNLVERRRIVYVANVIGEGLLPDPDAGTVVPAEGAQRFFTPAVAVGDEGVHVQYGDPESGVTVALEAANVEDAERRILATFSNAVTIDSVDASSRQDLRPDGGRRNAEVEDAFDAALTALLENLGAGADWAWNVVDADWTQTVGAAGVAERWEVDVWRPDGEHVGRYRLHADGTRERLASEGPLDLDAETEQIEAIKRELREDEPPSSPTTRETLVVLRVVQDDEREWWEALGLPAPERWSERFGSTVYARVEVEGRLR